MSYLKTPFVIIPIFANVVLLVGIRYFNTFNANPPMLGLFPLLMLALVWVWVMYFLVGATVRYFGKRASGKRAEGEDGGFV
ncbi:MAG: hypothetical protein KOO63_12500 [Bacteroidales bacterium]|nr:hypothetical protein [Candidatus Latescibacterota bacterium]